MAPSRAHGHLLAADVGELVGVSGSTIGQWARRGYILSSQRQSEPRVYAVEDAVEAAIVHALLERGARRADVRGGAVRLRSRGTPWPLASVRLGTVREPGRTRLLIDAGGGWEELGPRGWQGVVAVGAVDEVPLRLAAAA